MIAASVRGHRGARAFRGRSPAGTPAFVEAPEIVEADLRPRQRLQLPGALGVEMAQQPPADAVVRHRSQLLLDAPERSAGSGTTGRDLGAVERTRIEPHRIHGGKPADGSRQVDAGEQVLAAMPFE